MATYTFKCAEPECPNKVRYRYEPIDVAAKWLTAFSRPIDQPPVESAFLMCAKGHTYEYYLADGEQS